MWKNQLTNSTSLCDLKTRQSQQTRNRRKFNSIKEICKKPIACVILIDELLDDFSLKSKE